MKTLRTALTAVAIGLTAFTATAQDYPVTYGSGTNSTQDARYPRSVTVTAEGQEGTTIQLATAPRHQLYFEKTTEVVTVPAGANISTSVSFNGEWMNTFVYVDEGNDGQFSYEVDEVNHTAKEGSDLKSFGFYSFNVTSDATGYNSKGEAVTGDARNSVATPDFTAPTAPGDYRMRVKVDWCNIDPAGAGAGATWGTLQANGGVIVDFTLRVESDEPVTPPVEGLVPPYTIDFTTSQEGWTAVDKSHTPGTTWRLLEGNAGFYDNGEYYSCVGTDIDWSSNVDDYYISPAFTLSAGNYDIDALVLKAQMPDCTLMLGTNPEDLTSFEDVTSIEMGESYSQDNKFHHTVTIPEDGTYYFAFHATTSGDYIPGAVYLFDFSLNKEGEGGGGGVEVPTVEIPYEVDFKTTADGWEAKDNNNDHSTWQQYTNMGVAVNIGDNDDSLLSPKMNLEAGKTYKISTKLEGALINAKRNEIALLGGTDETSLQVVTEAITLPETGVATQEHYFTPTETGLYRFAFHLTANNDFTDMPIYVSLFAIEENTEEPGGPVGDDVFTAILTEGDNPAQGWTIYDENCDMTTWVGQAGQGLVYNSDDATYPASEHAITPAIDLTENQDYLITATFTQSGAFEDDLVELKWGPRPVSEAMNLIATVTVTTDQGAGTYTAAHRMTAPSTGKYYFDFRVITSEEMNGVLTLKEVHVTPIEKATPTAVTELAATRNSEGEVTLSWTNPTVDTNDLPITGTFDVKILENNAILTTVEGQVPGEVGSYTYTPAASLSGVVTYQAIAKIGDKESAASSVNINLDDIEGSMELLHTFPVSRTNQEEWTKFNVSGTSEWIYDYSDVFTFRYNLAQKNENDWLITPVLSLDQTKRYVATYELKANYENDVEITVGNAQTIEAQTQVIASHPGFKHNDFGSFQTDQFCVTESGDYYFGFHVTNANSSLSMRNLSIYYIDPTGINELETVKAFAYNRATATVLLPEAARYAVVYDMQGRLVMKQNGNSINLKQLPKGVYTVKAITTEGQPLSMKVAR